MVDTITSGEMKYLMGWNVGPVATNTGNDVIALIPRLSASGRLDDIVEYAPILLTVEVLERLIEQLQYGLGELKKMSTCHEKH